MSAETGRSPEPPPLPPVLLGIWPFFATGALLWLIGAALGALFYVALMRGREVPVEPILHSRSA